MLSAALWSSDSSEVQEVWAEPEPTRHILATMVSSSFWAETLVDGRRRYSSPHPAGMTNIIQVDGDPRALLRGLSRILYFYIPDALIQGIAAEAECATPVEIVDPMCAIDRAIERIGSEVLAEMRADQPLSRLCMDPLGQDLAVYLLRRWSNLSAGPDIDRGRLAPWQVKRAVEFLMSELAGDVSVAELAACVRLSPFHFARAFKRSTGPPPQRYLMERRVELARELLAGTGMGLAEIALACGFTGQSHFTTAFKRLTGVTTSAWRAAVRHWRE